MVFTDKEYQVPDPNLVLEYMHHVTPKYIKGLGIVYKKNHKIRSFQERSKILFVDLLNNGNDLIQFGMSSGDLNDVLSYFLHHLFR